MTTSLDTMDEKISIRVLERVNRTLSLLPPSAELIGPKRCMTLPPGAVLP